MSATHVVFIALTCLLSYTSCHKTSDINIILRTCGSRPDGCPISQDYNGPDYYSSVLRLMSGGIVQILYQDLDHLLPQVSITAGCQEALRDVRSRLHQGNEAAFQIIDSSAKFPTSFLQRTVTSYGDYDQCLAVSSDSSTSTASRVSWVGKYCMVDTNPETPVNMSRDGKLHLERHFFFAHTPVFHGLCFPSTCDENDVRTLVAAVIKPFPFRAEGDVSCDTRESISYYTRAMNMTKGQIVALIVLLTVGWLISVGTVIELLPAVPHGTAISSLIPGPLKKVATSFSPVSNAHDLLREDKSGSHMIYVDWIKLIIICAAVFAHLCCCLETPLGFFVMSHHTTLAKIVSHTFTQFFFNDGGLGAVTFLSGFASYHQFAPLIKSQNLSYGMAVFDRWLRFFPSVMAITCLDFIWPLMFSGPFYTRVGKFTLDKCSNNWWYNALFISIYKPALELCAPHTYYTSIDFNMFLLGLVAIYLLVHYRRVGIAYCALGIIAGNALLYYFTWLYKVTPTVLMLHTPAQQVVNYLDVVQMSLYAFFCSYFSGILLADMLKHGFRVQVKSRSDHIRWIIGLYVTITIAEVSPALYNTFDILPQSLVPLYIVFNRLSFTSFVVLLVLYIASTGEKDDSKRKKDDGDCNNNNEREVAEDKESRGKMTSPLVQSESTSQLRDLSQALKDFFSSRLMIVLTRLSFSIFMVNYFFIRSDFFTSRVTMEASIYTLIKRAIVYSVFITMSAVAFQLAFVSPAARLRKLLNYRITRN